MKILKMAGILVTFVIVSMMVPGAKASQTTNLLTRVTFNQPVQIPGHKILPAGTYWFTIPDTKEAPNTLAIYDADQTHVEAIVATRPTQRPVATGNVQLTFVEQGRTGPDALVQWFFPGRSTGQALVYSGRTERQINHEAAVNVFTGGFAG